MNFFPFLNEPFKAILLGIDSIVGNYGWSIVLFTLLIRLALIPFDVKSRRGMRKTQKLQPQIAALQKKYKNDKEKLNQKTMELYRKEHVSALSGCLPMLLTLPILFAMYGAMNLLAHEQIAGHVFTYLAGGEPQYQSWLWVNNIWMPDSPFASKVPDEASIRQLTPENWQAAYDSLNETQKAAIDTFNQTLPEDQQITFDFSKEQTSATVTKIVSALKTIKVYSDMTATVPGWRNISVLIATLSVFVAFNGFLILPVLAAGTQFLMSSSMPQAAPAQDGKPNTGNVMKWMFPIFSLMICFSSNAGFALYWVTANIFAGAQNLLLNRYFDAQEKKAATVGEGTVK